MAWRLLGRRNVLCVVAVVLNAACGEDLALYTLYLFGLSGEGFLGDGV
jgi:hypothetical protein